MLCLGRSGIVGISLGQSGIAGGPISANPEEAERWAAVRNLRGSWSRGGGFVCVSVKAIKTLGIHTSKIAGKSAEQVRDYNETIMLAMLARDYNERPWRAPGRREARLGAAAQRPRWDARDRKLR